MNKLDKTEKTAIMPALKEISTMSKVDFKVLKETVARNRAEKLSEAEATLRQELDVDGNKIAFTASGANAVADLMAWLNR